MSKKTNTLLFILGGTVFNILITLISFFLFIFICSKILDPNSSSFGMVLVGCFVAAIVASFLVYRLAIKIIMKKVDMEKYFDPIFGPRRPRKL